MSFSALTSEAYEELENPKLDLELSAVKGMDCAVDLLLLTALNCSSVWMHLPYHREALILELKHNFAFSKLQQILLLFAA